MGWYGHKRSLRWLAMACLGSQLCGNKKS